MADQESLEKQIADLEQRLQQKRIEASKDAHAPYERQEVHEAMGEEMKRVIPEHQPKQPSPEFLEGVPSWQDPALAPAIQDLVNTAFDKGPGAAIEAAERMGSPALIDALHDALADGFYRQLIDRKKLEPAA